MRALLLSLPVDNPFFRSRVFPNLGICSLAGNTEAARVWCMDLLLARDPDAELKKALLELEPDVVGISAMSFQYARAEQLAARIKAMRPETRLVLGGYHATTGSEPIATSPGAKGFEFLVRGEGERCFDQLLQALDCGDRRFDRIPGLSYWDDGQLVNNPRGPNLDLARIKRPARHRRLLREPRSRGVRVDTMETSRGCTHSCSICNILQMYGRNYRAYAIDRVIEDALVLRSMGVQKGFFIDDNITLDVKRFKRLLQRLVDERVGLQWLCQVSSAGIASDPELAPLMAAAGVVHVYVGFEHMSQDRLGYYKTDSTLIEQNRVCAQRLKDNKINMFGSFLVGMPEESKRTIDELVVRVRELDIDLPFIMCVTPFLGTQLRQDLMEQGFVDNPTDFSKYDIEHVNVRTRHLSAEQLRKQQIRALLKLYLDPRIRAGRNFYKSVLGGAINFEEIATVMRSLAKEMTGRLGAGA